MLTSLLTTVLNVKPTVFTGSPESRVAQRLTVVAAPPTETRHYRYDRPGLFFSPNEPPTLALMSGTKTRHNVITRPFAWNENIRRRDEEKEQKSANDTSKLLLFIFYVII